MSEDSNDDESPPPLAVQLGELAVTIDESLEPIRELDTPEIDVSGIQAATQPVEESLRRLNSAEIELFDAETLRELADTVQEANEYFDRVRTLAEDQIDLDPPWDYDPSAVSVDDETIKTALKWTIEARWRLEDSNDDELEKLAQRIEHSEKAFVEEIEDEDAIQMYKSLYLLTSIQDALVTWLCENDTSISRDYTNDNGEDVYSTNSKRQALEDWYSNYSVFDIESGSGADFKDKWNDFFNHRHRIMHGHPEAYYDENLATSALLFLGLTSYVAAERADDLSCSSS